MQEPHKFFGLPLGPLQTLSPTEELHGGCDHTSLSRQYVQPLLLDGLLEAAFYNEIICFEVTNSKSVKSQQNAMVRVVWISLQTWSHPNEPLMQVHQCKMYTQFFFFFLMRAMKQKLFQFFKSHFCDIFQIFYPNFISGTDDDLMITATMMTMVYLDFDDKASTTHYIFNIFFLNPNVHDLNAYRRFCPLQDCLNGLINGHWCWKYPQLVSVSQRRSSLQKQGRSY